MESSRPGSGRGLLTADHTHPSPYPVHCGLYFVSTQTCSVQSLASSQGVCLGLGSTVGSPTTLCRCPSFQAETEVLVSRVPHSGEGGGQGLLRPLYHLPAVIHLVLAETGELLGGEAAS